MALPWGLVTDTAPWARFTYGVLTVTLEVSKTFSRSECDSTSLAVCSFPLRAVQPERVTFCPFCLAILMSHRPAGPHGAGLLWQECLPPGGWGAPTRPKDKIRVAWTTPLATLQTEQSRRIGSLLHPPLCSSPQWGQPTELCPRWLRGGRTLAPTLTYCWPGWPSPRPSSLLLPVPWGCVGWRPRGVPGR